MSIDITTCSATETTFEPDTWRTSKARPRELTVVIAHFQNLDLMVNSCIKIDVI
jgi:hypothetical protein